MKKIVFVLLMGAMSIVSCKKEEGAKPVKIDNAILGGGKTNLGEMD